MAQEGCFCILTHDSYHIITDFGWDIHSNLVINILGIVVVKGNILDYFSWQRALDIVVTKRPTSISRAFTLAQPRHGCHIGRQVSKLDEVPLDFQT